VVSIALPSYSMFGVMDFLTAGFSEVSGFRSESFKLEGPQRVGCRLSQRTALGRQACS
jgi:hypothetical protein